jgi:hypothetical protein
VTDNSHLLVAGHVKWIGSGLGGCMRSLDLHLNTVHRDAGGGGGGRSSLYSLYFSHSIRSLNKHLLEKKAWQINGTVV